MVSETIHQQKMKLTIEGLYIKCRWHFVFNQTHSTNPLAFNKKYFSNAVFKKKIPNRISFSQNLKHISLKHMLTDYILSQDRIVNTKASKEASLSKHILSYRVSSSNWRSPPRSAPSGGGFRHQVSEWSAMAPA